MSKVVDFPQQGTIGITLRPKRYDIEVYQDDSFEFNMAFSYGGVPTDVTGWTGLCEVKTPAGAVEGSAVLSIVGPPTDGIFKVNFDTVTGIDAGDYEYDIQFTDAGGKKRTYIGGKFIVTEDISD